MSAEVTQGRFRWTLWMPLAGLVVLVFSWGTYPPPLVAAFIAVFLIGAVLAAVHHAEVVAHKVGEPFGSLVLAVAVTVIEVALIVTLMISGGDGTATLARDTVFAALMITINGIVGISLVVGAYKHHLAEFNAEGTGSALATVVALAGVALVLPAVTTSGAGLEYSSSQLAFAAVASLVLYGMFVFTQTVRHRDFFLPVESAAGRRAAERGPVDADGDGHADPPTTREALVSLALLVVSLVVVVGLAKTLSPTIEAGVDAAGFPRAVVGVVIALLVLLPESIAAVRAALTDRAQVSLNLAMGSAMASIGLTIPTIAVASIWLDGPLALGLEPTQIVLLAVSVVVAVLTVVPGRAKPLAGGVHLVLLASFIFLSIQP
ncbi:ionic transporter y4hA [Nocardioides nanhaiensis]|uniref:Calcium:proton antiporter n=1 Tax=Nocardioides nanhaiensis TaxID=1476871 RepID=A0ABP8W466_9ACTN